MIKKIIFSLTFILLMLTSYSQGIVFFKGTFEEAKTIAKKEKKKIFIDVYTSWCGPCKKMSAEVFPHKTVGNFYNSKFICMKIDAEKESTHDFFKAYKASSYPSYFWVDENGVLLDKQGGSCSPEVFISFGEKALKSNLGAKNAKLKARWEGGERSYELVNSYIYDILGDDNPKAVRPALVEFVKGLSDSERKSVECFEIVKGAINLRGGDFKQDILLETFLQNFEHYETYANKYDISIPSIYSIMYTDFVRTQTALYLDEKCDIEAADEKISEHIVQIKKMGIKYVDLYEECIAAEKLLYTKKYNEAIPLVESILNKYGKENPYLYSNLLYSILLSDYYRVGNNEQIDIVLNIATKALQINPCKANVFYYAVAQNANGNTKESISALANIHFYKGMSVSNAIYSKANINNIRKTFPEANPNI